MQGLLPHTIMQSTRSYSIIGPGALGGLYGARLHQAGWETHFLFHNDFAYVKANGLRVDSPWGNLHLKDVKAYGRPEDMPRCDVVCVCLKTTQNHLLPTILPQVTKPGSVVILMQNGLGAEEEVAAILPEGKIAGGLCYLCSNKIGPGHIHHVDYGQVTLGAHTAGLHPLIVEIAADFQEAGIPTNTTDTLAEARWRKLGWNIPYNGLSVVLSAETNDIMAEPHTRQLSGQLMEEVLLGARACGYPIEAEFVQKLLAFTNKMKPYSPSMLLDYRARRPLEIEYIYERPLQAAAAKGVQLPRIATLAAQLRFLDARNRR